MNGWLMRAATLLRGSIAPIVWPFKIVMDKLDRNSITSTSSIGQFDIQFDLPFNVLFQVPSNPNPINLDLIQPWSDQVRFEIIVS